MITPAEIKTKAENKYFDFLRATFTHEPFFPLEIAVGKPKNSTDYAILRDWTQNLLAQSKEQRGFGYELVLEKQNTRLHGVQSLPQRVVINTPADFLKLIHKQQEFAQFQKASQQILHTFPQLAEWLGKYPQKLVAELPHWEQLLTVCTYFVAHPRPRLYLRELPLTVDTKFVEQHKAALRQWLDILLPPEAIEAEETEFARRYGLRDNEPEIRLRLLDPTFQAAWHWPLADFSAPASAVAQLNIPAVKAVVVENKTTFLTLPPLAGFIAIWGGGYKVSLLKTLAWLRPCAIWYWGDFDAQGFEILSQLRHYFPQTKSWLMDEQTFAQFAQFAVPGTPSKVASELYLTAEEQTLYHHLKTYQLRLEQERLPHGYVVAQTTALLR